ncbi:hypothetical protein HK101_005376, partial [Irineochytrium annulatum]
MKPSPSYPDSPDVEPRSHSALSAQFPQYPHPPFVDSESFASAGQTTIGHFSSEDSHTSVRSSALGDESSYASSATQLDSLGLDLAMHHNAITRRQALLAMQMKEDMIMAGQQRDGGGFVREKQLPPVPVRPPPLDIDYVEEWDRRLRRRDSDLDSVDDKAYADRADAWKVDSSPRHRHDADGKPATPKSDVVSVSISMVPTLGAAPTTSVDGDVLAADPYLILPCAPSDDEKMMYLKSHKYWLYGYMLFSFLGTQVGLWLFIKSSVMFYGLSVFAVFTAIYLGTSIYVNLAGRSFNYERHLEMVQRGPNVREQDLPTVDVFLPCCGEPLAVLRNTYDHVQLLDWPNLRVHVLDDGGSDEVQQLAAHYGFAYMRRENRPHLKKAGNLRHAFARTNGDFFVIFDADFCPRSDMLREVMPYMIHDPKMGIVQTPQFFRLRPNQSWVEKGAALSQELFYRLIQVSRDHFGGAICVGTCAIYRRESLAPHGGTAEVEHSEDVHTGFLVLTSGWKLKYVPVNLAMGICPNEMQSFFNQQYRWGSGSTSLLTSMHFWRSKISFVQRLCFMSGMFYYAATALSIFFNPLPGLLLLLLRPDYIRWFNLAFALPSIVGGTLVTALWTKQKFGLH